MYHYIQVEAGHEALDGPYSAVPIDNLHTSPILTRPKSTSDHRRVIIDLSWPHTHAVNTTISKDVFLNTSFYLTMPTVDQMVDYIQQQQGDCYLFKIDLA